MLGRLTAGAVRPGWPHPSWAQGQSLHHLGWKPYPLLNPPANSSALSLSLLQAEGNQQQQLIEQFRNHSSELTQLLLPAARDGTNDTSRKASPSRAGAGEEMLAASQPRLL